MNTFAFFQNLQGWELILIFFVILLLFGGKRLPELARGLGKSIREFRRATTEVEETVRDALETPPQKAPELAKLDNEKNKDA
jgi:sec-independent protein translocase protein TatA